MEVAGNPAGCTHSFIQGDPLFYFFPWKKWRWDPWRDPSHSCFLLVILTSLMDPHKMSHSNRRDVVFFLFSLFGIVGFLDVCVMTDNLFLPYLFSDPSISTHQTALQTIWYKAWQSLQRLVHIHSVCPPFHSWALNRSILLSLKSPLISSLQVLSQDSFLSYSAAFCKACSHL